MSAKAGTFEGTQRQVSWTGAWIAALMLTAILALSLFVVNRSSGTIEKAPGATRFELSAGGPGGPSRLAHRQADAVPASQGIMVKGWLCHQCR